MLTIKINTRKSKHFVLTVAAVVAIVLSAAGSNAQQLRQGISVQMPVTSSATTMPEADNEDAWIIGVTPNGSVYFGVDPVTPDGLAIKMTTRPRNRQQNLYIKADARAPYADVEKVLQAGRTALFETAVLLTSQAQSSEPGTMVPPKGLEVLLVPPAASQPAQVQLINSREDMPILKINNRQIPLANLQNMLAQIFQDRPEKVVLVKADGQLPFADVVHMIDACHSAGAKVVLTIPGFRPS
jgi:biopolymer transport protein ExbD